MTRAEPSLAAPPRLRPGLVLFPLDDDIVVLCEETQCLVGLNPTAMLVFQELQQGTPVPEIAKALEARGRLTAEEARRWVALALDALSSHGLLLDGHVPSSPPGGPVAEHPRLAEAAVAVVPPYQPAARAIERRYRMLASRVLIRFAHPAQVRLVDAVLGHLAVTEDDFVPNLVMEIQAVKRPDGRHLRSFIYRDGERVQTVPTLSKLAPVVKGIIWQAAVDAYDFLFYIHAGVVGTGESCILLPAAPGGGKSSTTTALVHAGFEYFSDEVALIQRGSLLVPPMPLAICSKSTGWEVMARYYPNILELPQHGRADGKMVRYIPPPKGAGRQAPAPVSHIVFPRYQAGAVTELKPVSRSEALGRLMVECLALREPLDQTLARQVVEWVAGIDCYALTFSSLDEAVALVKGVVSPKKDKEK